MLRVAGRRISSSFLCRSAHSSSSAFFSRNPVNASDSPSDGSTRSVYSPHPYLLEHIKDAPRGFPPPPLLIHHQSIMGLRAKPPHLTRNPDQPLQWSKTGHLLHDSPATATLLTLSPPPLAQFISFIDSPSCYMFPHFWMIGSHLALEMVVAYARFIDLMRLSTGLPSLGYRCICRGCRTYIFSSCVALFGVAVMAVETSLNGGRGFCTAIDLWLLVVTRFQDIVVPCTKFANQLFV